MGDITQSQRDAIDEIMDNFEFSRVHDAMVLLDWKWASSSMGKCPAVPSEYQLRRSARKRLCDLFENNIYRTASGGLVATKDDGYLSLEFVLSEWDSEYE